MGRAIQYSTSSVFCLFQVFSFLQWWASYEFNKLRKEFGMFGRRGRKGNREKRETDWFCNSESAVVCRDGGERRLDTCIFHPNFSKALLVHQPSCSRWVNRSRTPKKQELWEFRGTWTDVRTKYDDECYPARSRTVQVENFSTVEV